MSVRDTNTAYTNGIKVRKGQLYSDACADVLRKYLELKGEERRAMQETAEFQEAYRCVKSFYPDYRKVMFGEDLVEKINHS